MIKKYFILFLAVSVLYTSGAGAQKYIGRGIVTEVLDGERMKLNNGTFLRLAGIQAPLLGDNDPRIKPWPRARESKRTLEELVLDKKVMYALKDASVDRYGYILAHVYTEPKDKDKEKIWVQGEMLKKGMARVVTYAHIRKKARKMQTLETQAREAGLGIWGHPFYEVIYHTRANGRIGKFALVSGRINKIATQASNTYLNFGENWKTDFTIIIPQRVQKMFQEGAIEGFNKKYVLVRGWIEEWNGPAIKITHPEQIQVLSEKKYIKSQKNLSGGPPESSSRFHKSQLN